MRSFVAMFLQWFPITCALQKCCTVVASASNIAICRDHSEHTAKNQTAVFQSGTTLDLKHLAVAQNCVNGQHSIRSTCFFSGRCILNNFACLYFKILFISRKIAIEAQMRSLRHNPVECSKPHLTAVQLF